MPQKHFKNIENIAQILSLHNAKLHFLTTPLVLRKIINILPPQLKQILSDEAVLCDIFYYRTGAIDAGRAKFRVRTSNPGYAQILRMNSSKSAIYQAICTHLRYCPDDAAAASMIKRRAAEPLSAANRLNEREFGEFSVVINVSAQLAAAARAREQFSRKVIKISRQNQPLGEFKITAKCPQHREQLERIQRAIKQRLEQVARIDAQRACAREQRLAAIRCPRQRG